MYSREQLTKFSYFSRVLDGQRILDVLDPLSGLISKVHMLNFVKSLIDEKIPFTLGMIDLDNFKYINDTYGHSLGDDVIVSVSNALADYLNGYGLAGRFGGDEFLFVNFRDLNYDANKKFCLSFYGKNGVLRKNYQFCNMELFITGTTGMASYPVDTDNFDELFLMADKTLYRGKSKGRNCYIIYVESKHKNIEIIKLKRTGLYETLKNLAVSFDSSLDLSDKLKAGFKTLKNDMKISDMYYAGKSRQLKSIADDHLIGDVSDIDKLAADECFATNDISIIKDRAPILYEVLLANEIEAILIVPISLADHIFGYLVCAEPHTLRIWQEEEYAILFTFARSLSIFMQGKQLELE